MLVPVIDISPFGHGDHIADRDVADAVDDAACSIGFMQITGHGIGDDVVSGLAGAMDSFFAQPAERKQACRPADVTVNRGYSGPRTERLASSVAVESPADLFEAFNVGRQYPGADLPAAHYPANIWPAELPAFQAAVLTWMQQAGSLARRMTDVFAVALGLSPAYFRAFTTHSIDVLRLNHYRLPATDVRPEPERLGMGPHTDYGIVTVLWADAVQPGLQILAGDGEWHDVAPAAGALLINLGDLLARWTDDRWVSTMHRVLAPVDATGAMVRRRSAAFFHDGDAGARIEALPGSVPAGATRRYPPITVGEHLERKLGASRGGRSTTADRDTARVLAGRRRY